MSETVTDKPKKERKTRKENNVSQNNTEQDTTKETVVKPKKERKTRKEHNRIYYEKHKKRLLSNYLEKVNCPLCNRVVASCKLKNHQKTKLCEKWTAKNDDAHKISQLLCNPITDKTLEKICIVLDE